VYACVCVCIAISVAKAKRLVMFVLGITIRVSEIESASYPRLVDELLSAD
jgi:hypothetical protein